jgi:hypothetical protein
MLFAFREKLKKPVFVSTLMDAGTVPKEEFAGGSNVLLSEGGGLFL